MRMGFGHQFVKVIFEISRRHFYMECFAGIFYTGVQKLQGLLFMLFGAQRVVILTYRDSL